MEGDAEESERALSLPARVRCANPCYVYSKACDRVIAHVTVNTNFLSKITVKCGHQEQRIATVPCFGNIPGIGSNTLGHAVQGKESHYT